MQDSRVTPTADEMDRRRVILKDGRYLFFYTFRERDAAPEAVSSGKEGVNSEAKRIV
jgi:hypothetical protein